MDSDEPLQKARLSRLTKPTCMIHVCKNPARIRTKPINRILYQYDLASEIWKEKMLQGINLLDYQINATRKIDCVRYNDTQRRRVWFFCDAMIRWLILLRTLLQRKRLPDITNRNYHTHKKTDTNLNTDARKKEKMFRNQYTIQLYNYDFQTPKENTCNLQTLRTLL